MRKVIYLLSDGKLGLLGASKIFVEMVAVKKDNPSKYYKILKEAQVKSAHLKKMLRLFCQIWNGHHINMADTPSLIMIVLNIYRIVL